MNSTKGPISNQQQRNRNRYTVSTINSVVASSTGIQLASSSSITDPDASKGLGLCTLEEEEFGGVNPSSTFISGRKIRLGQEEEEEEETVT